MFVKMNLLGHMEGECPPPHKRRGGQGPHPCVPVIVSIFTIWEY